MGVLGIVVGFVVISFFIIVFLLFIAECKEDRNESFETGKTKYYYELKGVKTVKDDKGIIIYSKINEKDYRHESSLKELTDEESRFFDNYASLVKVGKDYIKRDINFLPEDIFDLEGSYTIVVKNGRILDSFKITEDNIDNIEDIIRYEEVEKK